MSPSAVFISDSDTLQNSSAAVGRDRRRVDILLAPHVSRTEPRSLSRVPFECTVDVNRSGHRRAYAVCYVVRPVAYCPAFGLCAIC